MKWVFLVAVVVSSAFASAPPTGRYKTVVDSINALRDQYPTLAHVYSIGTNDEGTDIFAIRISVSPQQMDPKKIGQLIVSTHHGNESAAPVFTLAFIKDLLNRYSSNELWRGNLADMEWTIIPVLNISGYNANQREERGHDPNRDYANPCLSTPGGKLKSIRVLVDLLKTRSFTGSVTVHGYHGSFTYPWGLYANSYETNDHNQYHQIFSKSVAVNGYRTGTASDVVYPANGCYEDYVYWKHGSWSGLLELSSGSTSDINSTVPAMAMFFDQLDSSPSNKHDFNQKCSRDYGPDLRIE